MITLNETNRKRLNEVMASLTEMHEGLNGFQDRLRKAFNLITSGNLLGNGECKSESNPSVVYHTSYSGIPATHHCDCKDFQNRGVTSDYGRMCKHTLANLLSYLAKIELPKAFETDKAVPALLSKLLALGNQGQLKSGELIGRTSKGGRLIVTQTSGGFGLTYKDQMRPAVNSGLLVRQSVNQGYQSALKMEYRLSETAINEYENFVKHCK